MAAKFVGFGAQRSTGVLPNGEFNGPGYIAGEIPGIVKVNGVAASRRVLAVHRRSHIVVAGVFSNSDGTYRMDFLNPTIEFDVIGRDWNHVYNDVIVARVLPYPHTY